MGIDAKPFHLLVRIKEKDDMMDAIHLSGSENLTGVKQPHQYFSNWFNAYTKALNIRLESHGTLFERPFKRKLIDRDEYLKQVILYIHNNPVHHGFCGHPIEYPWSSYLTCLSIKPTKLKRDEVMEWFDNKVNFQSTHQEKVDVEKIEQWLDL